jgi:dihydroorotate dehydrogenase (fumarate)
MTDLSTTYLGLKLRTPLVPSASPLTQELDSVRRLEDAGASALVLYSVFEEKPAAGSTPESKHGYSALERYTSHLRRVKESVSIPVIGSIGASTQEGWVEYARQIQQAGADALELNLYQVPSQLDTSALVIEDGYVDTVRAVRSSLNIPVTAKLSPFFTSLAHVAKRLDAAGVDGLVLFSRFYQPDINLDELAIQPSVLLSTSEALRLPLTWIGILYGRVKASLAGTSGVHNPQDIVKLLLAGADVTMVCSTLLRNGISHLRDMESGLRQWMEKHELESLKDMKGSLSQVRCADPEAFERAQYINAVKGVQNVVVTGREAWRILTGS